jgi:N-hydroxyarylamine O-acetyltransferase
VFDLDAYLQRIGLRGRPDVRAVHRAHVTSIPFENLDPRRGVPVSLAVEDLQRKMVRERRGGYCFEQNLLLKAGLEALGARVDVLLGRVRLGAAPGAQRPRGHVVLRVHAQDASWHADVGFGHGGLLEPIPFGPGVEHDQAGWRIRVVRDGEELVLQELEAKRWKDVYGFVGQPVPFVDLETSNWWVCTHPHSPFRSGLIVTTQRADGTRASLSDWDGLALTVRTPSLTEVTSVAREDVPELLATRFDLPGFEFGDDGSLVPGDR